MFADCDVREQDKENDEDDDYPVTKKPHRPTTPRSTSRRPNDSRRGSEDKAKPPRKHTDSDKETKYPSYIRVDQLDQPTTSPTFPKARSSRELVEQFLAQVPQAPGLPPSLFSEFDGSERVPEPEDTSVSEEVVEDVAPAPSPSPVSKAPVTQTYFTLTSSFGSGARARTPPRPRFERSLVLRGELTVPRADYSETYTVWYNAKTGEARVSFHGGSTSTYRTVLPDGSVQRLEMRVDRSGDGPVRRCGKAVSPPSAADRALPALPDVELFSFDGYEEVEVGGALAERWRHEWAGRAGEGGAARGEALTLRHDLLLRRATDGSATPLRYTVSVNSSVLGADCDGYQHRYLDVREATHDRDFFTPNIDELCDHVEQLNASSAEDLARLEPLLEFTSPHRDLRYDEALQQFKTEYNRQYLDDTEEAVRKNLLMQHLRFIHSGNREGATFELASNYLADRLDAELEQLRGVELSPENTRAEQFPHDRAELKDEEARLPDRFDWRPRGAVSPVRYQGSCASCWAFAVAGAVEGALFVRTRRLVPLSEQCLVDCAHPFGGNGCKGTWPSHAYDYVQNRGLPALDDYPAYKEKVDTCEDKKVRPVTRISGHVNVTANSVTALKVAIKQHAPSVVIVDAKAKSFVFYKKGVLYDDRCAKMPKKLNHAVLAVGWGQRKGEPHFILKNSWSEAWGERGFVRVQARANTCGVLARASYPRLAADDVLRDPHDDTRVRPRGARPA
ncbi:uncharacterized protein LOC123665544 [Melitaea cinxia]|uniref:uncharacterized protein LOC123665544 n=1 Tax=Melitaea cinxia TaxID=113334 RepID=UPI001E2738AC|nr:uncharacterized protein LOC123665544 [Melitaea cinxia]